MTEGHRHRLLVQAGTFFLACGFAARFLMLDGIHPVIEATGIGLLLLGSGLLLLEQALRGGAPASAFVLVLPLLVLFAARSTEALTTKRAIDVWAACVAGFAIRDLAREGLGAHVRASLTTAAIALALFGIAQTAFIRNEVVREAHESHHALTLDGQGLAFLNSWRATGTFVSPNAFGGFLLLCGMPLVFVALASLRTTALRSAKTWLMVLAAIVFGGFVCAGSAGAAIAGAMGVTLVGWLSARGRARRWLLAGLVVIAVAAGGALITVAVSRSDLSGKLRTLQERIDYHRTGFRVLSTTWPYAAGLERTGTLMLRATRPGESFSRYIHDWWLQGLVEGGIAFVPVAIALIWAIVRGVKRAAALAPAIPATGPAPAGGSRAAWWWSGILGGAILGLVLEPFVSVIPYGLGPPIVCGVVTAAVFAGAGTLVWRLPLADPAFTRGLAAGCGAFAIHGFVDFDLYVPGVMLAFATALALLAETEAASRPPSRFARVLTGFLGIVSILAPVAVVMLAETREHVH